MIRFMCVEAHYINIVRRFDNYIGKAAGKDRVSSYHKGYKYRALT